MAEAADGGRLRGINIEDGKQLGYLQDLLEFLSQIRKLEGGALRAGAMVRRNQRAEPSAVDVSDVTHIQDDLLFALSEQFLYLFPQGVALFAENDTPVKPDHSDAIHFAHVHFECHGSISFGWVTSARANQKVAGR